MAAAQSTYRVIGMEGSPYSVKTRSYFRYKQIPHEWLIRRGEAAALFQKHAKLPLVPLVLTPEDEAIQDSTPILEAIEARHPEPSIHPDDPVLAFVSALLEEFGDEWGNKWMFHYRWAREADQVAASGRIVAEMMPDLSGEQAEGMARSLRERMTGRVWFVGSNEDTAPQIEQSYADGIERIEVHLASRPYLFGGRPAFGDFGLWGQLYNASLDPTAGAILRERAPATHAWVERMLDPTAEGDFEPRDALLPTLRPLLEHQVGRLFLPWSDANARAIAEGADEFSVELDGGHWHQKPQKYHARSLAALRKRYAATAHDADLDRLLDETGCLDWLKTG